MRSNSTRRQLLFGAFSAVSASFLVEPVQASTVTLSGRIVSHSGAPMTNRRIYRSGGGSQYTDSEGHFEFDVESNSRHKLAFYRRSYSGYSTDEPGVPVVYGLGQFSSGSEQTDLGTISLPKAYRVRGLVLDSDGEPVRGAEPHVYHNGFGTGHHPISTEGDGLFRINNAQQDGIDLSGLVDIHVHIPLQDGGKIQYGRSVSVDGPKVMVFQVGEGVTVKDGTTFSNEEQTTTTTEQPTATTQENTRTKTTTTMNQQTTTTSTPTMTTTQQAQNTTTVTTNSSTNQSSVSRGFFSNNAPAEEYKFVSNPLFLTVGGFVLSAAGILHQLLRGR